MFLLKKGKSIKYTCRLYVFDCFSKVVIYRKVYILVGITGDKVIKMADTTTMGRDEVGAARRMQRDSEDKVLDQIAGKVFDAYRAALGDDFTAQGVISASTYGYDITNWDSIPPEMQDTLDALCVKHPKSVDREKVSSVLSDAAVAYLREKGVGISDEQVKLFPDLMKEMMQGLESAGANFSNGVRQARILGLTPLVDYRNWLVDVAQGFMDLGQYCSELKLIDNAITASQDALTTALVAAGDIEVNYRLKGNGEMIERIVKAGIIQNALSPDLPFVVTYETKDGKTGKIDVLRAAVTSLTEKADKNRLYDLLFEKKIDAKYGSESLGYEGSIAALVGLPQDVTEELRANVWRKHLKTLGVDFSQNAEAIVVDPKEREKTTFFYGTKLVDGQDNGVMVAFTFNERYGSKQPAFVIARDKMQEWIRRAEHAKDMMEDASYTPLLKPMAVHDYVKNRREDLRPKNDVYDAYISASSRNKLSKEDVDRVRTAMQQYGDDRWWESKDPVQVAMYQVFEDILLVDFSTYHEGLEKFLGRPVAVHEIPLNIKGLREEARLRIERYKKGIGTSDECKETAVQRSIEMLEDYCRRTGKGLLEVGRI